MRALLLAAVAGVAMLGSAGCGGASDAVGGGPDQSPSGEASSTIALVTYSTPQVVYDEVIPDFNQTAAGKGVKVTTSYGASGEQSRAVEAGLPADVVTLSVEPDITRLVTAGLVDRSWNAGANKGLVTTSLVSFIVRPGNPKNIRSWEDLVRPGVEVITPNPFSSGAAKWNLLGAYSHGGLPFVEKLLRNVKVQPKSGREALQIFAGGKGDVLISYEYEAITAQKKGERVDYVVPEDTLRIDIDIAMTRTAPDAATAFLAYVLSEPAQLRFADWGYRPVNETALRASAPKFPTPKKLKTIDDLGGWAKINEELFDPERGTIAKLEESAGVSKPK